MASVSIQMTADDYVRASRLARRGQGWWILALIVGLILALPATAFVGGELWLGYGLAWTAVKVAALGWVAALTVVDELSGFSAGRRFRNLPANREPILNSWTPDGLERRVSSEVERTAWADVRRWREDRHTIVVFTRDHGALLFPKRQVPPAALDELRSYLAAPPPAAATAPPPPVEPEAAPLTEARAAILTEDDFIGAHALMNRGQRLVVLVLTSPIPIAAAAVVIIALADRKMPPASVWLGGAVFAFLWALMLWFGPRRQAPGIYRRLRTQGAPLDFTWGAEGVDVRPPGGWRRLPWTEFPRWRETPDLVLLSTTVKGFMAIPRRSLTPADLERLRGYLVAAGSRERR